MKQKNKGEKLYYFDSPKLEKIAQEVYQNNPHDVIKIPFENHHVWLKRPRESHSTLLHRSFYTLTQMKGVMPVQDKTKQESLVHEIEKIKRFKQKGINVPKLLGYTDDFFLLEDTGVTVKTLLKERQTNTTTLENTLEKCVHLLAQIHNNQEYHAGPQIKNYTLKEESMYAIDFEDSFPSHFKLEDIQFRDFFLFLVSLAEIKKEINYKEIVSLYEKNTSKCTIGAELKSIALKLNFLVKLVECKPINTIVSKDVIYNYNLFKALQQL